MEALHEKVQTDGFVDMREGVVFRCVGEVERVEETRQLVVLFERHGSVGEEHFRGFVAFFDGADVFIRDDKDHICLA